jgi:hypothetical protein
MSSTRSVFSRFREGLFIAKEKITSFSSNPYVTFFSSFLVAGIAQLLDTACNQKLLNEPFKDYYDEAPSRIAWLVISSLFLGMNLHSVIETLRGNINPQLGLDLNPVSAKKILIGSTIACSANHFIQKSLSTPIARNNALVIMCSTAINGPLSGSLMAGGVYILKKLNYKILPLTSKDMKLMSLGMLISILQELLDFMCTQMIEQNALKWDSLASPTRLLALHLYNSILQGVIYGISLVNLNKYSQLEPWEDRAILKVRNIFLGVSAAASSVGIFVHQALTVPIQLSNAPYILTNSLVKGGVSGIIGGSSLFTIIRLVALRNSAVQQNNLQRALLDDDIPAIDTLSSPGSLLGSSPNIQDNEEHHEEQYAYVRQFP